MPHPWSSILKQYRAPLRHYFEVVIPFYVKRNFNEVLQQKKLEYDEKRILYDDWYRFKLIYMAGLRGLFSTLSKGLAEIINEVKRIWPLYHSYLSLLPGAIDFQTTMYLIDKSINVLEELHRSKKYPPTPFVWNYDHPREVKEKMIMQWLGEINEDVILALDIGDCLAGWITNIGWIEALSVYLPSLDVECTEFYLKEAEVCLKYFTIDILHYGLIERHKEPEFDPKPWYNLINQIRELSKKQSNI